MQMFAIAVLEQGAVAPDLSVALRAAARPFPQLDPSTLALERSRSGQVLCARMSHPPAVAAPRRYAAVRDDALVLFDGFPLERRGRFAAHDAVVLAERWSELPDALEGIFSAVRIDLRADRVECLLDVLGMAPVFLHRGAGMLLLANSVEALRHAAALRAADPLVLASLIALGWPAGDRAALRGVEILRGGGLYRLVPGAVTFAARVTPATVARAARSSPPLPAQQLLDTTRAAVASGVPLHSALTGGRDTRVLLALTRATGADVTFFTSGSPDHIDVRVARHIAEQLGLHHRVVEQSPPANLEAWAAQTTSFVERTDGLSPIDAISDHLDHDDMPDRLALELWGAGGEIGRILNWVVSSLAALAPLARRSYEVQRRVLQRAALDPAGLLAPDALAEVRAWIDAFAARRRAEGWPPEAIYGSFYSFGRVRCWAARGVRRAAATTDLYSPFVSQAYIEHCLGLPAGARYVEQPHRQLIGVYAPEVDAQPYERAWRPQRPELALAMVLEEGLRRMRARVRARSRGGRGGTSPPSLGARWFEAGLPLHRDVALSSTDSPLWDVVDRRRYEVLLAGTAEERQAYAVSLGRVLAALWYISGPGRSP